MTVASVLKITNLTQNIFFSRLNLVSGYDKIESGLIKPNTTQ